MEPFGLFQLLNSLLPKAPQTEEKTEPATPVAAPSAPAEEPPKAPPNACLDFFERHERMRRRNRP